MSVSEIQKAGRGNGPAAIELAPTGDELKQAVRIKTARATKAVKTRARRYADAARSQAEVARQKGFETVQARPLASVSVALGLGVLAGFLLGASAAQATARLRTFAA